MALTDMVIMPGADYQDACNAVREKTGGTAAIKSGEMGAQIRAIDTQENLDAELTAQDDLIAQISAALDGKAAASVETCTVEFTAAVGSPNASYGRVQYTGVQDGELVAFAIEAMELGTTIQVAKNTMLFVEAINGSVSVSDTSSFTITAAQNVWLIVADGAFAVSAPCFARNTLIALADGTAKAVQDITYDDTLLVWDFDSGCYASAKPLWIKRPQTAGYYYLCEFDNGSVLKLIGSGGKCHRVFSLEDGCFLSATDCTGKRVMTADGPAVLLSCNRVDEPVEFYNIITHHHINLFAENVLTSCRLNNLYPIEDMKFVKEDREAVPMEAYDNICADFYKGLRLAERKAEDVAGLNEYIKRLYDLMETEV